MNKYRKTLLILAIVSGLALSIGLTSTLTCYITCNKLAQDLVSLDLDSPQETIDYVDNWSKKSRPLYMLTEHRVIKEIDDLLTSMEVYSISGQRDTAEDCRRRAYDTIVELSKSGLPFFWTAL